MGENIYIVKKDGKVEHFNGSKIRNAVNKSAVRVMVNLTDIEHDTIIGEVLSTIIEFHSDRGKALVSVEDIHKIVEVCISKVNKDVAESYRSYRNYKTNFNAILDEVWTKTQTVLYRGDKENSNADSSLVSTKQALVRGEIAKELYKQFFLTSEELKAIEEGQIYVHDMRDRLFTMNCCLADVETIMSNGFESGNIWYNEPKSIDTACDVLGDIIISMASQQYGGFTVPSVDVLLSKYCNKSYNKYLNEYRELITGVEVAVDEFKAHDYAVRKTTRDLEQGLQGLEIKLNSVSSSRGDYPFVTFTFGVYEANDTFAKLVCQKILEVRRNGQGKEGRKKPVLFPKLNFFYRDVHRENGKDSYLFDEAVLTSAKAMYPDYISLVGDGYIPDMYKKHNKPISLMGCRASLSPYYVKGGITPLDDTDEPIFVGRFNIGAVSLHLPLIYADAKAKGVNFYTLLRHYLDMIRNIHIRTYSYLGKMKASTNPLAYTQGGFYGGNLKPEDTIESVLESATASFGITALNELCHLHYGKSITEDNSFAKEVMQFINDTVKEYKNKDNRLYAVYGTPAESLVGLQVKQFRKKYGVVSNVSDREYMSNSFHCHVADNISPIEKQDKEYEMYDYFNGGKIMYNRYPIGYNIEAIKTLVRRAMELGTYQGVNIALSFCEDCGHEEADMNICPKCNSINLTKIDRMNGYLSYSRVKGDTRLNSAKMVEIKQRISM